MASALPTTTTNMRVTRSSTKSSPQVSGYTPVPQLPGSNTKGYQGRQIDTYDRAFDGANIEDDYRRYGHRSGQASLSGYYDDGFVVEDGLVDHGGSAAQLDTDATVPAPGLASPVVHLSYHNDCYISPVSSTESDDIEMPDAPAFLPDDALNSDSTIDDFLLAADLDGRIDTSQFPSTTQLMKDILENFASVAAQFEDAGLTGLETGAVMTKICAAITEDICSDSDDSDSDYQPYTHLSNSVPSGSSSARPSDDEYGEHDDEDDSDYYPSDSSIDYDGDGPDSLG